jgi:hypothetical protein
MSRGLSFADAVALLGGRSRLVEVADRLTGGLLLAASASGSGLVMTLFDPKNELSKVGGDLVAAGLERVRGLSRFDRSQRLAAAHAVIVTASYFDAVAETDLPFTLTDAQFSIRDEVAEFGSVSGDKDTAAAGQVAGSARRPPHAQPAGCSPEGNRSCPATTGRRTRGGGKPPVDPHVGRPRVHPRRSALPAAPRG